MYVDVIVLQALPLLIEAKVEKAETQRWLEKMVIHISLSLNIIFSAYSVITTLHNSILISMIWNKVENGS